MSKYDCPEGIAGWRFSMSLVVERKERNHTLLGFHRPRLAPLLLSGSRVVFIQLSHCGSRSRVRVTCLLQWPQNHGDPLRFLTLVALCRTRKMLNAPSVRPLSRVLSGRIHGQVAGSVCSQPWSSARSKVAGFTVNTRNVRVDNYNFMIIYLSITLSFSSLPI